MEKPFLPSMCALDIYLPVVMLFPKEPAFIPIFEHTLILGGVNKYKTIFYFFKHSSTITKQTHMRSINCRI
jgi:hypothetical protein